MNLFFSPYVFSQDYPINPKALSLGELYGEFDLNTNEWTDGVLSSVMRQTCADESSSQKWLLFDAPVDTLWIESMNSVMDDNKVLTLINGERISMPEQVCGEAKLANALHQSNLRNNSSKLINQFYLNLQRAK